jgi:hypothetical protein
MPDSDSNIQNIKMDNVKKNLNLNYKKKTWTFISMKK